MSLIEIEAQAFYGDAALDEVVLGENVKTIGAQAFAGSSVRCVVLPDGIQSIAEDAFEGCEDVLFECSENSAAWQYGEAHGNISLLPPALKPGAETPASYFSYKVNSDRKTCTITKFKGGLEDVVIPQKLGSYRVTVIGETAFYCNSEISTVYIPEGVTGIDGAAFKECTALKAVYVPSTVKKINVVAFSGCTSLANVTLSEGVTTIGESSFKDCASLRSIRLPGTLTTIGATAFYGCESLRQIAIPGGVKRLENEVFRDCTALESVTLNSGLTYIGRGAFTECHSLTRLEVPDTVTTIGEDAFWNAGPFKALMVCLPDGITTLGSRALFQINPICNPGTTTEKTLKKAGYAYATYDCPDYMYETETVDGQNQAVIVQYIGTDRQVQVPDTINGLPVARIGQESFGRNERITSVWLPDTVVSIEQQAFLFCENLTSVRLSANLKTIGVQAFVETGLRELDLPDGIRELGGDMISHTAITEIEIPASVEVMTWSSVWNDALERVTFRGENALYEARDGLLYSKDGKLVMCPAGRSGMVAIPEGTTEICSDAFFRCEKVKAVIMPDSLTTIRESAFFICTELRYVLLSDHVTSVDSEAAFWSPCCFYCRTNSLTSQTLAEAGCPVRNMEWTRDGMMFYENEGLMVAEYLGEATEVVIPAYVNGRPVTEVGPFVFQGNDRIQRVVIPEGVKEVYGASFNECANLREVVLPEGMKVLRNGTFLSCPSLESLDIPDSVYEVNGVAAKDCPALTRVRMPAAMYRLRDDHFVNCDPQLVIELPDNIWYTESHNGFADYHYLVTPGSRTEQTLKDAGITNYSYREYPVYGDFQVSVGYSEHKFVEILDYTGSEPLQVVPDTVGGMPVEALNASLFVSHPQWDSLVLPDGLKRFTGNDIWNDLIDRHFVFWCTPGSDAARAVMRQKTLAEFRSPEYPDFGLRMCEEYYDYPNAIAIYHYYGSDTELIIPGSIGGYPTALYNSDPLSDTALTKVVIQEGMLAMNQSVFSQCRTLRELTLPSTLEFINNYGMYRCEALETVVLSPAMQALSEGLFYACESLTSIAIPEGVRTIQNEVFGYCRGLAEVSLPSTLREIGERAFDQCESLTAIELPDNLTSVEEGAFSGCNAALICTSGSATAAVLQSLVQKGCIAAEQVQYR